MSSITPSSFIISYREVGATSSCFLDINEILKSEDIDRISSIYNGILLNINSYESSEIDKIEKIGKMFYERLKELSEEQKKDPLIIKILKIVVFVVGIYEYIINMKRDKNIQNIHNLFIHHIAEIKESLLPKKTRPPIKELQELYEARKPDLNDEWERLMKNSRIKVSLNQIDYCGNLHISQKVAIAQSIELREKIGDKYYVINHGQSLKLMVVNIIARRLKQIFEPEQFENFQVLRHDVHLKHIKDNQNVQWFRRRLYDDCEDENDGDYKREMIAGDCVLENNYLWESAISFFLNNTNIALGNNSEWFITDTLTEILRNYFPDQKTQAKLLNEILKLIPSLGPGGNLYSICIPKKSFGTTGYFSYPFGTPVERNFSDEYIDEMQRGKSFPELRMGAINLFPQVRLLTHKLNVDKGVLIVLNSTLTPEKIDKIEENIDLLIQKAQMRFRI